MAAIANATGLGVPRDGLSFPAGGRGRPAGPADPRCGRRPARRQRAGRGRRLGRAGRRGRAARQPALGRLRGLPRPEPLCPRLLRAVRAQDRRLGPLRRALAALPPDRARARRLDRRRRAPRRADRRDEGLGRRRRRGGEARSRRRRAARRRGRLLRLGQARARRAVAGARALPIGLAHGVALVRPVRAARSSAATMSGRCPTPPPPAPAANSRRASGPTSRPLADVLYYRSNLSLHDRRRIGSGAAGGAARAGRGEQPGRALRALCASRGRRRLG